jgi:predicted nucleotidyltransferase
VFCQSISLFTRFKIKSLALSGSVARHQVIAASDSDVLVELDADPTLDLHVDLKFSLEDLFEKKVDLVIKTDIKPQIADMVLAEVIHR